MNSRFQLCIVTMLSANWLLGQAAIYPVWTRLVPSSSHITRLALDQSAERLHLAFQPGPSDPHTHIRAFHLDGTDVPPPHTELTIGLYSNSITGYPYQSDRPLRLLAQDDSLYFVNHFLQQIDFMSWYRTGLITLDSSVVFSMHTGADAQVDVWHDQFGDISATPTVIRNCSKRHWLLGRAVVPTSDRIAADEMRIYCGRVPSIAVLDRHQMTLLNPITVPSSGTSTRTLLMLNADVIHYASLNSNMTMDVGAVDTTGTVIWSGTLSTTQYTTLSGITLDAFGSMWVAASQGGSSPTGLLYRFNTAGTQTGNYLYGRTIDDIVCSGDHVFLSGWDAVDQGMVYLAAFGTDITTSIEFDGTDRMSISPNPANDLLTIRSIPNGTKRIELLDATGRTVTQLRAPFGTPFNCSVAELAPGSYFIRAAAQTGDAPLRFNIVR